MWWIRSDICGLFSAGFTVLLLLYAQYVMVTIVILPWYGFNYHVPLYTFFTLLALISHTRAQFTNPGAIPLDRIAPPQPQLVIDSKGQEVALPPPPTCRRCRVLKPYKAHHCSACGRCIIRMDHHCPWVNNCVAIFNQKYFVLFLLYTAICCLYSGTLLVSRFISCTNNLKQCNIAGMHAVLCILNFIEAIIFGLFCTIMMWDQLSAIFDNTPGIDALQNKQGKARGKYESLKEVFGEPLSWRWWLPLRVPTEVDRIFASELEEFDDPENELRAAEQHERMYQQHLARQQEIAIEQAKQRATNSQSEKAGHTISSPTATTPSTPSAASFESISDAHHRALARSSYANGTGTSPPPIVFPDSMIESHSSPVLSSPSSSYRSEDDFDPNDEDDQYSQDELDAASPSPLNHRGAPNQHGTHFTPKRAK